MASSVNIDNLAGEIVLAVKQYTEDVSEEIEKEVTKTAKAVQKDIYDIKDIDHLKDDGMWFIIKAEKSGELDG